MIKKSYRYFLIVFSVILTLLILWPVSLLAQESPDIVIKKTDITDYPEVDIFLNFKEGSTLGSLDLSKENFYVLENNDKVIDLSIKRVARIKEPIGVVIVLDTSGSMKGEPIADAIDAALVFMNEMRSIDEFAVVGFADDVTTYSNFTSNRQELKEFIYEITAEGETSLYDGIFLALDQFNIRKDIKYRYAIVLSDGTDTVSKLTTKDVINKAKDEQVTIFSVALMSYDFNPTDIGNISESSGGELLIAANSGELKELYRQISWKIRNQYKISYTSLWPNTETIKINIIVEESGLTSSVKTTYENPFYAPTPTKIIRIPKRPFFLTIFDRWWMKLIIYASIFIGVTLFLYVLILLIIPPSQLLKKRTEFYGYKPVRKSIEEEDEYEKGGFNRFASFISKIAAKRGFVELFTLRLERAGMKIRGSEFISIHIIVQIISSLVIYTFTNNLPLTVVAILLGAISPFIFIKFKASQRIKKFHEQLPDTLQLIGGSLKAGYSFNQALSMVQDETKPPISDEFKRVLSEIRMGSPEKDALDNMAKRINSEHFDWTVMAINVQREVGGNLAEVMDIIASTIRERDRVMNQIKTLTAEGRISAYILIALPIVVGMILSILNREYVSLLVTTKLGLIIIAIAFTLMVIGTVWIIKIVRVDY
ncbi:MAG: type II secretion system F family protein [Actinobacteria bacterium]|nr:type II secretion system F family protein [Actinomycetota bacterium]